MGIYINPPDREKEAFLFEHGNPVFEPSWPPPADCVLVCLVDNGAFSAAGVAYNEREFQAFMSPDSGPQRPRLWYYVYVESLWPVIPESCHKLVKDNLVPVS